MRGLRTQENKEFLEFFSLVQEEAKKRDAVFFADCGMGDITMIGTLECEDLCGWMIPRTMADDFEKLFTDDLNEQHYFDNCYCFVDYELTDNGVKIVIE